MLGSVPVRAASPMPSQPSSAAMEIERLRYMAEQIARNFAAQGESEAIAATADHIAMFWDPRMKAQILADDRSAMTPAVAAAIDRLARKE